MFNYKLVKIHEVIAEGSFTQKEDFIDIPIGQRRDDKLKELLPIDSHVDREKSLVEVSLLSCEVLDVQSSKRYNLYEVELAFMIQKELVIIRPSQKPLELEYLFRRKCKKVIKAKKKDLCTT